MFPAAMCWLASLLIWPAISLLHSVDAANGARI
jgi:hypothetical protein